MVVTNERYYQDENLATMETLLAYQCGILIGWSLQKWVMPGSTGTLTEQDHLILYIQ
jgi:hypothetical protein